MKEREIFEDIGTVIIESVSEYIQHISKITNDSEDSSMQFFFRGQANKHWVLEPSVFRDNLLAKEAELIELAYRRAPFEFEGRNEFDKLTKLQHYGLPTRLLDVTLNPLVALYFACEICTDPNMKDDNVDSDEQYDDEDCNDDEIDGIIYYKSCYAETYKSKEVGIIATLATTDTTKGFSLVDYLPIAGKQLIHNYTFNGEASQKQDISEQYDNIIKIIQSNYFVISSSNNDRLIRQSGAFLLAGCFRVNIGEDERCTIIEKNKGSLRKEFENNVIVIPAKKKRSILSELDYYNINKGTLFPELEHQMSYIKAIIANEARGISVGIFEKISRKEQEQEQEKFDLTEFSNVEDEKVKIISKNKFPIDVERGVLEIVEKTTTLLDWQNKESLVSEMRSDLKRFLTQNNYDVANAVSFSKEIADNIRDLYKWKEQHNIKN